MHDACATRVTFHQTFMTCVVHALGCRMQCTLSKGFGHNLNPGADSAGWTSAGWLSPWHAPAAAANIVLSWLTSASLGLPTKADEGCSGAASSACLDHL